jgi:hypothetical protein
MKITVEDLKNLKLELPCDPSLPLLVIYLKKFKSTYNRGNCKAMFIAALFTIVKCGISRHPSTNEQIRKTWYIYRRIKLYHLWENGWTRNHHIKQNKPV